MKYLLLFLCLSCGDSSFRKIEELNQFRILAIEVDTPEVAPNTAVTLTPFVSDPLGPTGGREIIGTRIACIDPGISLGAAVDCSHDPTAVSVAYTIDTRGADFQNNGITGFSSAVGVTVPATILASRSAREQENGVAYIVIFRFTVDGKSYQAFKRILASTRAAPNTNPTGSAILLNGGAFAGTPQKGDNLSMTTSAPETYDYVNVDGSTEVRTEKQEVAWYITTGEFSKPKTNIAESTELKSAPPQGTYVLVGIVRDERGGLDVVRITLP